MTALKWIATTLILIIFWLAVVVYGALSGWWLKAIAPTNDSKQFISAIDSKVEQTMTAGRAGNVIWAVLKDGEVRHRSSAYSSDGINEQTLFPAASMSKLITAYAVLLMLEEFSIDLDEPIVNRLTRWQLPAGEYNHKVTLRHLLSHTAGLTDSLGFGDYQPQATLPSLEQSLSNPLAANGSAEIKVTQPPGQQWAYSGGGYLLMELLVEEITGVSFEQWVQSRVFDPLDMNRSTYDYLGDQTNISQSYNANGQLAPLFQYASPAATGLNTTLADLTKFAQALMQTEQQPFAQQMQQATGFKAGAAIWGLGAMLYAPTEQGSFVFGHDGSNDPAINATLRINPATHSALIALTTGPKYLASEIGYEWTLWQTGLPDFLHLDTAFNSAVVPAVVGLTVIIGLLVFAAWWRTQFQRSLPSKASPIPAL
ncbi:serine hydrolase domain-containing protein [Halioxenophilus aromaticivorans]|uniref:Beta-lactamase-related domain-containing protein n=1 Tax=Halioxenophilus aromaticivorans TaxID=1306992 RepID=A0AAV3U6M4_9ALTE